MFCSSSSLACDLFEQSAANESLLLRSDDACFAFATEQLEAVSDFFHQEEKADYSKYWSEWILGDGNSPIVSQHIATNYVGIGVWVPSELEDQLSDMDAQQWLMSHGLQLSLGFGDKKSGEPRMRLDYRWHDEHEADLMMQVELPF